MNLKTEALLPPPEAESLLMAHRGKTFAWASKFMPRGLRDELKTLYSFCRYVDDCVDCARDREQAQILLEILTRDLERKCSNILPVSEFLLLSEERQVPLSLAFELIRGVQTDISLVQMASEDELLCYSYQVAGTVGVMICFLLGVTKRDAIAAGIDLGIAMQLTNIARDIGEDYARGRVYLPTTLIDCEAIALAFCEGNVEAQDKVLEAVKQIISKSQTYYESADRGICFLPASARLAILTASRAYNKIGDIILRSRQRFFQERIKTTALDKGFCLAKAISALALPKIYRFEASPDRQPELHSPLRGLASFAEFCR